MDAFDADVLIFAAQAGHPLGPRIAAATEAGIGSLLLLPEVLSKPTRWVDAEELVRLESLLDRLELMPADRVVVDLAVDLRAVYRLKTVDAVHLATAVLHGADRFVTNNRKDFRKEDIVELEVVYPEDLPAA